jgi:hypothetical protein
VTGKYIAQIGTITENEAKFALSMLLFKRSQEGAIFADCRSLEGEDIAVLCSAAVMNVVFGEINLQHASTPRVKKLVDNEKISVGANVPEKALKFASENALLIESQINWLSSDDKLCATLSGAAYNACYARYIKAGGSRGIFSNTFITYIRTLFSLEHLNFHLKQHSKILDLGPAILSPIESMQHYGILRPFPHNPNERKFYDDVHELAVTLGLKM